MSVIHERGHTCPRCVSAELEVDGCLFCLFKMVGLVVEEDGVALQAIELSAEIRQLYERKLGNRTKDKDMQKKALNAVKFKLIREMFSVVKQAKNFELRGLDNAQTEAHSTEE